MGKQVMFTHLQKGISDDELPLAILQLSLDIQHFVLA